MTKQTLHSKYPLVDAQHLLVSQSLACKIGLKESALINLIDQYCQSNSEQSIVDLFVDGYWWARVSYTAIAEQYPFLGTDRNVQKMILKLEKLNILVSGTFNELKCDRTKWYRINHEQLEKSITTAEG